MKTGKILHRFTAKDGREVILRTPRWEDLDDLMDYINSLVDEGVDIDTNRKVMRDEEADWLGRRLAEMEKGEGINLVAEVNDKVIANYRLFRMKGYSSHVGEISIGIMKGYRNIGVGTEMLKTLIVQAKKIGLKMLILRVFSTNKTAYHVYEKAGFKENGRIPKFFYKNGKYIDEMIMTKEFLVNNKTL